MIVCLSQLSRIDMLLWFREQILRNRVSDLDRSTQPKQAHDDDKVNPGAEACR